MMWRQMDLIRSFLPLVSIATFWCVVYAQSDTNGPSNTSHVECIGSPCARNWWTSMWGFIVTLVALTMDVYGALKASSRSAIHNVLFTLGTSTLNPFFILWVMLEKIVQGPAKLANLREVLGDDVIVPLYPWSKSHIKIISSCDVIVNLSPDVYEEIHNLNAFEDEVILEDLSEALVIGTKVFNSKQFNVQLTRIGDLALLRSNVLPPYDELKILRGNSSLGVAIVSAQAIGYIYGVVVRCMQGLRVSPIEAIACVLNIVILIKGVLHNFASICHRPLLLYLHPQEEAKFINECKNIQSFDVKIGSRYKLVVTIVWGILLAVGAYFIINFLKSSVDRSHTIWSVAPIIFFELSLLLGGIQGLSDDSDNLAQQLSDDSDNLAQRLLKPIVTLNIIGYMWALYFTFKYWKGEKYDVQSFNYLSQVLPYIG